MCAWPPLELRTASGIGNRAADHTANVCHRVFYRELHTVHTPRPMCAIECIQLFPTVHTPLSNIRPQYSAANHCSVLHWDKKLNGRRRDYFAIDWGLFYSDWWTTTVTRDVFGRGIRVPEILIICWTFLHCVFSHGTFLYCVVVYPNINHLQFIRFTRDSASHSLSSWAGNRQNVSILHSLETSLILLLLFNAGHF